MDFDEWHHRQLNGDPDNCPHEAWERKAWEAALSECARICREAADECAAAANAACQLDSRLECLTEQAAFLSAEKRIRDVL